MFVMSFRDKYWLSRNGVVCISMGRNGWYHGMALIEKGGSVMEVYVGMGLGWEPMCML